MNILFVNPPNTTSLHVAEPNKYIEENVGNEFFLIPRIPFQVMASLPDTVNRDIILLDYEWYKNPQLTKEALVQRVIDRKPDVVFTTLIAQASTDSLDYLTTEIKKSLPKTKIVMGGQAVHILGERVFKYCPNIDIAYKGKVDGALSRAFENPDQILRSDNLEEVLTIKSSSSNVHLDEREVSFSPEHMYGPYRKLLEEIVKTANSRKAFPLGMLENFKGCPYTCSFCAAKKPVEQKNLKDTLKELQYLYDTGIPCYYFIDLTFGVGKKRTEELLDSLKDWRVKNSKFKFRCITRADKITERFVSKLLEAGCYEVGIGLEANSNTVLEKMNKRVSEGTNEKATKLLGESGLVFKLFMMEGYEGSSTESSRKTFQLLNELEERSYKFFIQPALSRDIIPSLKGFKKREERGTLQRGNMNQLDFRHDGRAYGWDQDRSVRALCYQMLAYPSTEISKKQKDRGLQNRLMLDTPFLVSRDLFSQASISIKNEDNKRDKIRIDCLHYIPY